jgi:xanthine dehydrogenase YagS FAD-binding subunit
MRPFQYVRASDPDAAARAVAANPRARFLAGGTNILDLMKEDVKRPNELVDLTRLQLTEIKAAGGGAPSTPWRRTRTPPTTRSYARTTRS